MKTKEQYIIDKQGKKTGVVLSIEDYKKNACRP